MSRELDRRSFGGQRLTPAREAQLRARATSEGQALAGAPEVRIDQFDAVTGNPAITLGAAPEAKSTHYVERALEHLRGVSGTLGFADTQPAEFTPDPSVQTTSSGATTVHTQQLYKGIPIFQAAQAVHFDPSGAIRGTQGQSVTVEVEHAVAPALRASEATMIAARYVVTPAADDEQETDQFGEPLHTPTITIEGYSPRVLATFPDKPDQPTVIDQGPFGAPIKVSLTWFDLNEADPKLTLAWEVRITMPDYAGRYRVLIDAASGDLLYCHQLVHQLAASGNVFLEDGDGPRQIVAFPPALSTYGIPIPGDLPQGFPDAWVADNLADGNNVYAHLDEDGPTVGGSVLGGEVLFNPANERGNAQRILNLFYYINRIHDYFYLLGFRERDGNFQLENLGRGGLPGDPVDARIYEGFVNGTASTFTPVEGSSPVIRMGLVARTGLHTALDSSVVYHEYTHGVTNRLVGGPLNVRALDAIQSQAMGEGWSDFFACMVNRSTVVGAWVTGQPGGIRGAPYDSNYPAHFGMLGQGRFINIHAAGEIWCAALIELSRVIGQDLTVRLVLDALRLVPANPGFLQGRDSILCAAADLAAVGQLSATRYAEVRDRIWAAFARFGMGPAASAPTAYSLSGLTPDFSGAPAAPAAQPTAPQPQDDLERITGIDAVIARKLRAAGIGSFAQLAEATPARLAKIIARSGFSAERIARTGWIEQARALADAPALLEAPPELSNIHEERQRPTSFTLRLNLGAGNSVQKTEIIHARDGERSEWAGWNERQLIDFVLRHAGVAQHARPLSAADRSAYTGSTQRLEALEDSMANPSDNQAQPSEALLDGETVVGPGGEDRLRLKLQFRTMADGERAHYVWEISARNLASGQAAVLAKAQGQLARSTPDQQVSLVVDLPEVGRYRLSSTLAIPEQRIFLQAPGPLLSVEP